MLPRDVEAWLRLSYAALPTAKARGLLRHFASPAQLLEAAQGSEKELREEWKLTEKAIAKLREAASKDVSKAMDAMEEHHIHIVTENEYPPLLQHVGDDTPPFLFVRGSFTPSDHKAIGIVGTRNITEYGRGVTHKFALQLAREGWTVVSGLARGIDTAAHRGALDGGGRTIAVTACGLDIVYPSDNRDLMLEIEQQGAVVSEWAPGTQPEKWHFPARNRVIAGLSLGIIVVEAAAKSGALITATYAAEFDRPVFAVPGNIHKLQSRGPHQLIKEGQTSSKAWMMSSSSWLAKPSKAKSPALRCFKMKQMMRIRLFKKHLTHAVQGHAAQAQSEWNTRQGGTYCGILTSRNRTTSRRRVIFAYAAASPAPRFVAQRNQGVVMFRCRTPTPGRHRRRCRSPHWWG